MAAEIQLVDPDLMTASFALFTCAENSVLNLFSHATRFWLDSQNQKQSRLEPWTDSPPGLLFKPRILQILFVDCRQALKSVQIFHPVMQEL